MKQAIGIDAANRIVAACNAIHFPNDHVVCAALNRNLELLSGYDVHGNSMLEKPSSLMLVTGSVQVFEELFVAVVDVEVVQVTAVLTGAAPQDARPKTAMDKTKRARNFTAPRSV